MIPLYEQIIRILLSAVFGAMVGWERERKHKPAGLKTHAIVALAAALATIVSAELFLSDPARLTAALLTGMGFLGAGAIIAEGTKGIQGLTTAATLWATTIVSIAIGAGAYVIGATALVAILGVLYLGKFEK